MPNTENDSSYKKIGSGGKKDLLNNYQVGFNRLFTAKRYIETEKRVDFLTFSK